MTCAATSSAVRLVTLSAAGFALLAPERRALGVRQQAEALARRVVQKIVPVALRRAVAEALQLVAELTATVATRPPRQARRHAAAPPR